MATRNLDPYKILGVAKDAPAEDVKKAYRKLARENHPDRNPDDPRAEERFKEIQQAYDIVGDPEKRKEYDRSGGLFGGFGGGRGGAGGAGADGFDPSQFSGFGDILSDLFGRGAGGTARQRGPQPQAGRDLETEVTLSFAQALEGAQIPLQVPMSARCATCAGTGAKPGTSPQVCPVCQGRGVETEGQGLFSISHPCSRCGGTGAIIEDPCPTCHGAGAVRTVKRLRVNIPAGVRDGSRIRLAGKGEAGLRGGPPGDLFVVTRVQDSPVFKRTGDSVEVEVPLSVVEALRGGTIEVPTLDGTKKLRIKSGTKHGTIQRIRGEGPPRLSGGGRGDIRYRFVIDVPEKLTKKQQAAVDELSKVMNGDPRAGLFAAAGRGASGAAGSSDAGGGEA